MTSHQKRYNARTPKTYHPKAILKNHPPLSEKCSCGIGQSYPDCCGRFIDAGELPSSPEELMRSRYTAYTQGNMDYIAHTMTKPASIGFDPEAAKQWALSVIWEKCKVLHSSMHGNTGSVEFIVYYYEKKVRKSLHERSLFHRVDNKWYYTQGVPLKKRK